MKISYGILCKDETDSLAKLLGTLFTSRDYEYEVVIIRDHHSLQVKNNRTTEILDYWGKIRPDMYVYERSLNNDFASQKNFMTKKCTGDWIINPDSDEIFPEYLLENIHLIIEQNNVEVLWLPRVNTVQGLTQEYINKWRWNVNELGYINWPDFQQRIYKNDPSRIRWENKVHERLAGFKTHAFLPQDLGTAEYFAIQHHKTLENQIRQNEKYTKIMGQI